MSDLLYYFLIIGEASVMNENINIFLKFTNNLLFIPKVHFIHFPTGNKFAFLQYDTFFTNSRLRLHSVL